MLVGYPHELRRAICYTYPQMRHRMNSRNCEGKIPMALAVFALGATTIAATLVIRNHSLVRDAGQNLGREQLFPEEKGVALSQQDTDQDGLKDWEETLYRTDKERPDTDADGTPDGEEVVSSRDPLVAGPDDSVAASPLKAAAEDATSERNYTNELGTIFAKQYLAENQNPAFDPTSLAENMLNSLLNGNSGIDTPSINPATLRVIHNNAPETVRNYFNALALVLETNTFDTEHPLLVLTNIRELGDLPAVLPKFDLLIARYQNAFEELIPLPVPSEWTHTHERAANILLQQIILMKTMRRSENDMVGIAIAISQYAETSAAAEQLRKDAKAALARQHIAFNENEPARRVLGL